LGVSKFPDLSYPEGAVAGKGGHPWRCPSSGRTRSCAPKKLFKVKETMRQTLSQPHFLKNFHANAASWFQDLQ
jgi:hypothetical protein